ncbi:MAG: DUF302 domain-containing protein [Halodesulfurarchaeum sp.]
MHYTMEIQVEGDLDTVLDATVDALSEEGFGILSEIDMGSTIEEKLDTSFRQYRILGACNPPLAHEALGEEIEIGSLLPCNVVAYEADDGSVVVLAADPKAVLSLSDNEALEPIAEEVNERVSRALDAVEDEFGAA